MPPLVTNFCENQLGNRFTMLHIENIEFKKFSLRDNVAQLCVLKVNYICSFFLLGVVKL